jgi:hypothetical protein
MQTMHGPLPAGVYDFYVRGVIGFGTPNEMILGKGQVIDNFLVIPEPAAGMLAAMAIIGLPMGRRRW